MRKLYIICIILISKLCFSQAYVFFPNDSAEWDNSLSCQLASCPGTYPKSPDQITQKGDTLINSKTYHKLYNKSNNTLHSFYREFGKKIYSKYPLGGVFANDTAEFILYDFNLIVGDTVYVKVPASWSIVNQSSLKRVISSITNTVLPSGTHKVFNFSAFSGAGCPMDPFKWIEGVGSDVGLLYNLNYYYWSICFTSPGPFYINLTCNFRNGNIYYSNGCTITSINETKKENISIYPNPTNSILNIIDEQNQFQNAIIEIKNYLGQVVFTCPFNNQINLSQLSSGMYFLFINEKESKMTWKIIKE